MSMARISVLGMMRYDNTIFDSIVLPSPPWSKYFRESNIDIPAPDRDVLVAHILRRTANLEIFYPNFQTLKDAIRIWSITNRYKWLHLWETMHYDYNPIWNKDAHYEEEEHFSRDLKDEYGETTGSDTDGTYEDEERGNKGSTTTESGTKNTTTSGTKNSTNTNAISSYNINGLQDRERDTYTETTSGTENTTTSDTTGYTENTSDVQDGTYHEDFAGTKNSTNDATGTTDTLRKRREYGNIGVTTTQQMLEAERELATFNWYDMVCDSFIAEFCINVF